MLKADSDEFNKKPGSFEHAKPQQHLEINPLHFITDFTQTLAKSLTPSELEELCRMFRCGLDSFEFIRAISGLDLVKEALGDLHTSVALLFTNPPQYGQSKWASLQATEKLLKAYIKKKGQEPKQIHNLQKLSDEANRLGMVKFNPASINKIQCKPDVRYGVISVSLAEAVEAHQAAVNICGGAALILFQDQI